VTEALDRVGTAYRDGGWPAPCRAAWAAAKPQAELAVLRGHDGYVNAVCTMPAGGRTPLLASADDDPTVRLWDPQTGTRAATVPTHYAALAVTGVADSLAIAWTPESSSSAWTRLSHASTPGREHQRSLSHIRRVALATGPAGP
jgi:WD40 repeat protein